MKDTTVESVLDTTFQHLETIVKEKNDTLSVPTERRSPRPKPEQESVRRRDSDKSPDSNNHR
jgi:hypothetical protein